MLRPTGVLVCATQLNAVRDAVLDGRLPPSTPFDEKDLMQAFREAGFGVAVRNRWDTAAHHAKVRQECAERAAQMRRALREEHFKRAAAAKRGPSGRPATLTEKLLEKEYRPELSTRMHRCDSCFEDVHAMASDFSVCTTVYVEENTSATSATSAMSANFPLADLFLSKRKKRGLSPPTRVQ